MQFGPEKLIAALGRLSRRRRKDDDLMQADIHDLYRGSKLTDRDNWVRCVFYLPFLLLFQ